MLTHHSLNNCQYKIYVLIQWCYCEIVFLNYILQFWLPHYVTVTQIAPLLHFQSIWWCRSVICQIRIFSDGLNVVLFAKQTFCQFKASWTLFQNLKPLYSASDKWANLKQHKTLRMKNKLAQKRFHTNIVCFTVLFYPVWVFSCVSVAPPGWSCQSVPVQPMCHLSWLNTPLAPITTLQPLLWCLYNGLMFLWSFLVPIVNNHYNDICTMGLSF